MAVVVIDPGHGGSMSVGGSDANHAVGPMGTLEKSVTLAIGLALRTALQARGHIVAMTRTGDVNLGLKDRAAVAKARNADVFVSIHCNGWHTPDVQGSETWLHARHGEPSAKLADALQPQLVAATRLRDRGIKSAGFGVLNPDYHAPDTAACLVEVSFLTDPAEEARLIDPIYQGQIALHLAEGVGAYLAQAVPAVEMAFAASRPLSEIEDAPDFAAAFPFTPTEPELWQKQAAIAEAALVFAIEFIGCRMGFGNDKPLDTAATGRLRQIVRAVSIVESRHGTQGANQPARDPFQCGNPGDSWWKELTGQSGQGSRFIRGPGLVNLWANEVAAAAEATNGFDAAAAMALLGDMKKGHRDAKFTPHHSYVWGIIYLIHRINTKDGSASYACKDLARTRLIDGAVNYNAGGVPDYRERIEAALKEIGDIPVPPLAPAEPLVVTTEALDFVASDRVEEAGRLVASLVAAAAARGEAAPVRRIELRFGSGRELKAAAVEFGSG